MCASPSASSKSPPSWRTRLMTPSAIAMATVARPTLRLCLLVPGCEPGCGPGCGVVAAPAPDGPACEPGCGAAVADPGCGPGCGPGCDAAAVGSSCGAGLAISGCLASQLMHMPRMSRSSCSQFQRVPARPAAACVAASSISTTSSTDEPCVNKLALTASCVG